MTPKPVLPQTSSNLPAPSADFDKVMKTKSVSELIMASNHWSAGLLASMTNPKMKILEDDQIVIIKDKYPKAKHHLLVLPKKRINKLSDMSEKDVPLIEHMVKAAEDLISDKDYNESKFRLGFHAIPSMAQVHLHVISQDFVSPWLKTKKHWNSFTTDFFVPPDNVIQELTETGGFVPIDSETQKRLLGQDLRCHRCSFQPKTMPDLKSHLVSHLDQGK